jgi:hypothetical protein
VEAFRLGDRHNGAGIGSRVNLKLEGGIGLNPGKKSGELCFGHADGSCYNKTLGIFLPPGAKVWFRFSLASSSAALAPTGTTGRQRSATQSDLSQNPQTGEPFGGQTDHKTEHGQAAIPDFGEGDKSKAGLLMVHGGKRLNHCQPKWDPIGKSWRGGRADQTRYMNLEDDSKNKKQLNRRGLMKRREIINPKMLVVGAGRRCWT